MNGVVDILTTTMVIARYHMPISIHTLQPSYHSHHHHHHHHTTTHYISIIWKEKSLPSISVGYFIKAKGEIQIKPLTSFVLYGGLTQRHLSPTFDLYFWTHLDFVTSQSRARGHLTFSWIWARDIKRLFVLCIEVRAQKSNSKSKVEGSTVWHVRWTEQVNNNKNAPMWRLWRLAVKINSSALLTL